MLQKIHHPPVWNRMNFLHMLACGVWPSHSHSLGSLAGPAAWFLGYQLPKKGPDLVLCFALQDVNLPETDTGKARTSVSGCGVRVSRWHCHHLPAPPVLLPWTTTKNRQSSSKHRLFSITFIIHLAAISPKMAVLLTRSQYVNIAANINSFIRNVAIREPHAWNHWSLIILQCTPLCIWNLRRTPDTMRSS